MGVCCGNACAEVDAMWRNAVRFTAALVLAAGMAALAAEPGPKPTTKAPLDEAMKEKIKGLVKQLGDDDFVVRENASKKLEEIGRPAVPFLREALKAGDLEVRMR